MNNTFHKKYWNLAINKLTQIWELTNSLSRWSHDSNSHPYEMEMIGLKTKVGESL